MHTLTLTRALFFTHFHFHATRAPIFDFNARVQQSVMRALYREARAQLVEISAVTKVNHTRAHSFRQK